MHCIHFLQTKISTMKEIVIKELISAESVQQRVRELGEEISSDYEGTDELVLVCVLKGAFLFAADLFRSLTVPCRIEFIQAKSYGGSRESSGKAVLSSAPDIKQRDILLVDGIVDTGLTVSSVLATFRKQNPASLRVCAFLDKPSRRQHPFSIEYSGFTVPDVFIVGYGCDYDDTFRGLPFIGIPE